MYSLSLWLKNVKKLITNKIPQVHTKMLIKREDKEGGGRRGWKR